MITYLKRTSHSQNVKQIIPSYFTHCVQIYQAKSLLFQSLYLPRNRAIKKLLTANISRSKNVKIKNWKNLFPSLLT